MNILVNAREKAIPHRKLSYEQIVVIAYGPTYDSDCVTITYFRGPKKNPEGSLSVGQFVNLKNGMSFTAARTNRA